MEMNIANSSVRGRILELDGLRGLAILLVVVWHYFYFYPDPNHHPADLSRALYVYFERCIAVGWSGVDLFYVLSGFLIGGLLLGVQTSPTYFKTFYLRRFFRIIPVYYAWTALYGTDSFQVAASRRQINFRKSRRTAQQSVTRYTWARFALILEKLFHHVITSEG